MTNLPLTLLEKMRAGLAQAGRNRNRARLVLSEMEQNLNKSSGPSSDPMYLEYHAYLMDCFCQALSLALAEAHETEEYEAAAEIKTALDRTKRIATEEEKKLQEIF